MNREPTAYSPGFGSLKPSSRGLLGEELVRDLHQDAGAVAHARIGADRAAMLEIAQDAQAVLDDLVRLAALDVGDEADAAGVLVERRIVQALRLAACRDRRSRRATASASRGMRRDPAIRQILRCVGPRSFHPASPAPAASGVLTSSAGPTGAAVNAQPISRRAALPGRRRRGCSRWAPPMSAPRSKAGTVAATY